MIRKRLSFIIAVIVMVDDNRKTDKLCVDRKMDSVIVIKFVSALLYPMGLIVLAIFVSWIFSWFNKKSISRKSMFFAIVVFLLSSNTHVSLWLASQLEKQYPQMQIRDVPEHDAIIVLGGALRIPTKPAKHTQLVAASDRYWYAVQLYRAGKAKKIILSGGNLIKQPGLNGEAFYARQLLLQWGVPSAAIILEQESRTTQENRDAVAELFKSQKLNSALLVTSAMHMPRAHQVFKTLPINITPASADIVVRDFVRVDGLAWLPSASAMELTTKAMHEYYGILYGRVNVLIDKGW